MIVPIRLTLGALLAASVLTGATGPVSARPFYNSSRYYHTRQSLTNRAIAKRLGWKPKKKTEKPAPARKGSSSKAPPRPSSR